VKLASPPNVSGKYFYFGARRVLAATAVVKETAESA
jgi:hypothetical protein